MVMRVGFGKVDITPRVGVPLCGFGPFLNRVSVGVRDRLWARAMAVEVDDMRVVVISCDIVVIGYETTNAVRAMVAKATGLPGECLMINCTHTHSGPDTAGGRLIGWGGHDHPYMAMLPGRIAQAAIAALTHLEPATIHYGAAPCPAVALNREYDQDSPPLEQVLADDWRPARPELTDSHVLILRVNHADTGRLLGFASYFGCHPVTCCSTTRYIHGDFVGLAMTALEREHPGTTGLFLQGAMGDVNSCVVHKPEPDALLAMEIIAARFANAVRQGLADAQPIAVDHVTAIEKDFPFTHANWSIEQVQAQLAQQQAITRAADASDLDHAYRHAMVMEIGLSCILAHLQAGGGYQSMLAIQGIRMGPVALLASPFEVFQDLKNQVTTGSTATIPLVLSVTNGTMGYAPDKATTERGGYAADQVPLMFGHLPFPTIWQELPEALLTVDRQLSPS